MYIYVGLVAGACAECLEFAQARCIDYCTYCSGNTERISTIRVRSPTDFLRRVRYVGSGWVWVWVCGCVGVGLGIW